jgi:hypothetical protein
MSEKGIQSKAFQRAALSSESNRIHWLVYILVALMLGVVVRNLFIGQFRLLYAQTLSCKAGLSSAATLKQPVDAKAILG